MWKEAVVVLKVLSQYLDGENKGINEKRESK
jgi:hypothetical protein